MEIRLALDVSDELPQGSLFIIPARLDECVVPERLNEFRYVDLFKEHGSKRLMNALNFVHSWSLDSEEYG